MLCASCVIGPGRAHPCLAPAPLVNILGISTIVLFVFAEFHIMIL